MSNVSNLGNFPHTVGNLDDRPNLTAAQMKAAFEQDVMTLWGRLADAIPYINDMLPASKLVDIVNSSSTDDGVPTAKAVYDAIADASLGGSAQQIIDDWLDSHPEATTTVTDGSITNAKLSSTFATPGVASAYVSGTEYPAGSYVFHGGTLYTNPEDVSDGVWTAAHWETVTLGADVSVLKNAMPKSNFNQRIKKPFIAGNGLGEFQSVARSSVSVENGKLKMTLVQQSGYSTCAIKAKIANDSIVSGHRYYLKISGIDTSHASHLTSMSYKMAVSSWASGRTAFTSDGVEGFLTIDETVGSIFIVASVDSNLGVGEYITFEDITIVDLTALYGAGKEPYYYTDFKDVYGDYLDTFSVPELYSDTKLIEAVNYYRNYPKDISAPEKWINSSVNSSTGRIGYSTKRMMFKDTLEDVENIETSDGLKLCVIAWDEDGDVVGTYNFRTDQFITGLTTATKVSLHYLKKQHPNYTFRLVVYVDDDTDLDPTEDYSKIKVFSFNAEKENTITLCNDVGPIIEIAETYFKQAYGDGQIIYRSATGLYAEDTTYTGEKTYTIDGQQVTVSYINTPAIQCSEFVFACLSGTPYETSRYSLGDNKRNNKRWWGWSSDGSQDVDLSHRSENYLDTEDYFTAAEFAEYCYKKGWLIPVAPRRFVENQAYQTGDYVFYNTHIYRFTSDFSGGTFEESESHRTLSEEIFNHINAKPGDIVFYRAESTPAYANVWDNISHVGIITSSYGRGYYLIESVDNNLLSWDNNKEAGVRYHLRNWKNSSTPVAYYARIPKVQSCYDVRKIIELNQKIESINNENTIIKFKVNEIGFYTLSMSGLLSSDTYRLLIKVTYPNGKTCTTYARTAPFTIDEETILFYVGAKNASVELQTSLYASIEIDRLCLYKGYYPAS